MTNALPVTLLAITAGALITAISLAAAPEPRPATQPATTTVAVTLTGGYDIGPNDYGRPVVLIASALKVTPDNFRKAFSGVTPAHGGGPTPDQARKNKEALMKVLEPLGVTNDRLDEVSNFYRYRPQDGELWKHTPATATATIQNGQVTAITLTNPGAGYTVPPKISVPGYPNLKATATLSYTTDLKTNGSLQSITLDPPEKPASH